MATPSDRQRAAALARVLVDEFRRSGFVPTELVRAIQARRAVRTGDILDYADVEREARAYAERICAEADAQALPVQHADDTIERAVDTLMTCTPTAKPKEWAEAIEIVEQAWVGGRLTRAQVAELDALDTVMAAKV